MKKQFLFLLLIVFTWKVFAQNTEVYDKLWKDPSVVECIENNIEKYRKGDAVLELIGANGESLTDVTVEIKQQTHEFLFGCNLFVLGQLKTPELNAKYENAFVNLFNFATIPFYWRDLEPHKGKPRFKESSPFVWRRPPPDQLLHWCEKHNITPKGHCLMYAKNKFMPDWTEQNNPEKFLEQAHKYIARIAKRYDDKFSVWDVVNEDMLRIRNLNDWHKVPHNYLTWCFWEAEDLFPATVKLLYNDGTFQVHDDTDEYLAIFRNLKENKVRVDGMGIQSHIRPNVRPGMLEGKILPPNQLIRVYKKLEQFGLPMYITEITVAGNGDMGDELQAKIVKNLYPLWFSTPNMTGITWWNLGDGTAYEKENEAKGGLLDEEMNPKPAYKILDSLINHEWKTNKVLQTNDKGQIQFRGFYGGYKIKVKYQGKTIEKEIDLSKSGRNHFTIKI